MFIVSVFVIASIIFLVTGQSGQETDFHDSVYYYYYAPPSENVTACAQNSTLPVSEFHSLFELFNSTNGGMCH